jgi:hypothetical protein
MAVIVDHILLVQLILLHSAFMLLFESLWMLQHNVYELYFGRAAELCVWKKENKHVI